MRTEIMTNKKINLAYASTATIAAATMLGTSTVAKAQDIQSVSKNDTKEPKKTESTIIDYVQNVSQAQKAKTQAEQTVAQITKKQELAQAASNQAHHDLTTAQNTITHVKTANAKAQTAIKQAETDKSQLDKQITTKQAELAKAEQATQTLTQNLTQAQVEQQAANAAVSVAQNSTIQAQTIVDQLTDSDNPTYAEHVNQVQKQITTLQDTLKTNTDKITTSQAKIKQNEQTLKDVTTQIQTTQAAITNAQLAVKQANDVRNKAQSNLADKSKVAQTAQTTLIDRQKQAQQIANEQQSNQTKLAQTQADLDAKQQELSTLIPQIKALRVKIDTLSNSTKDQTAAIAQAKAALASATARYNALNQIMQQDQTKVAALKQQLKDLQNEPINTLHATQSYLDAMNEYTALHSRLDDFENDLIYRHHVPQKEIWQRPEYQKMKQELKSIYNPHGKWYKRMHEVSGESYKQNIYKHNERERHHMVDLRHMTAAEKLELNKFGISLVNSVRKQFGRTPFRLNQDAIDFADDVVKNYYADNWDLDDHDDSAISRAAADYKLTVTDGNAYEDKSVYPFGTTSFADPAGKDFKFAFERGFAAAPRDNDPEFDRVNLRLSMDNLKFRVYDSIRGMIFNNKEWCHAADLTDTSYKYNPHATDDNTYSKPFGLAISVLNTNPKLHDFFGSPHLVSVHWLTVNHTLLMPETVKFGHEKDIEVTDPAQDLQKQIKQKRDSLVDAQAVFTKSNLAAQQAQTDLAKAQATYDALTGSTTDPLAQLTQYQNELADLQLKQSDTQIAVQTLTDDVQNLTKAKTALATRQAAIAQQVATAQTDFDQDTAALKTAQDAANQADTTYQAVKQSLAAYQQSLAKYNQIFAANNQANSGLVTVIKACQKTIADTQNALTAANSELVKAQTALTNYNSTHQTNLVKLATAKSTLAKAKQVETTAKATLAAKTKSVQQLQAQIAAKMQTINLLTSTIKQLQAQVVTLNQTIAHNQQILAANKDAKDQTASLSAIVIKADADLAAINAELVAAKDKLAQANKVLELAEKEKRAHEWNHEFDTILDPTVEPTVEPITPMVEPTVESIVEPTVELSESKPTVKPATEPIEPIEISTIATATDKVPTLTTDKVSTNATKSARRIHQVPKSAIHANTLPQTGTKQPATLLALVAGSIASILALACSVDRKKKN